MSWMLLYYYFFFFLGENKNKFGEQRMWGAIGWGIISVITGACVDWYSKGQKDKNYSSGFIISLICLFIDIYFVSFKLEAS